MTSILKQKSKLLKWLKNLFNNDKIPEEKIEYECIPCISVDSVLKIERKVLSTSLFRTV